MKGKKDAIARSVGHGYEAIGRSSDAAAGERSMKDAVFEKWWPLPRSMDLVRAPIEATAAFLLAEADRTFGPSDGSWIPFRTIDGVFDSVEVLTNFPTIFFALPASGGWTVLWNNSFLCNGYDSLCHNLTRLHHVDTLHWQSSDTDGPMLAGTSFAWRPREHAGNVTRSVYCASAGPKWSFNAQGEPLPSEPIANYSKRRIRERLSESSIMDFLSTLAARPWREDFYDLPGKPVFRVQRRNVPASITQRPSAEVLSKGTASKTRPDRKPGPPSYLAGNVRKAAPSGPGKLLQDGAWCGHGEPVWLAWDVALGDTREFEVGLPIQQGPDAPVVRLLEPQTRTSLLAYDPRRHPASDWSTHEAESPTTQLKCPECHSVRFEVAVGFELPSDSTGDDDTSWFALAVTCRCGWSTIAWDHETA